MHTHPREATSHFGMEPSVRFRLLDRSQMMWGFHKYRLEPLVAFIVVILVLLLDIITEKLRIRRSAMPFDQSSEPRALLGRYSDSVRAYSPFGA